MPAMKNSALFTLCIALTTLSGCVSSGGTPQQIQTSITSASMMTESASCNQIAQNIGSMDQIIITTSNQTGANGYNAATNAVTTGMHQSGAFYNNKYLRAIPGMASSLNNANNYSQLERQQSYNAQREKTRLVSLFQQKKCVRTN